MTQKMLLLSVIRKFELIMESVSKDFYQQKAQHLAEIKKLSDEISEEIKRVPVRCEAVNDMENIRINLEKITISILKKITRRVLFSKWAVNEMNVLISNARESLDKLGEFVVSRDSTTGEWLIKRIDRCLDLCQEYNKNHKERTQKATCYIEAARIYQHILDAFREIFENIKVYTLREMNKEAKNN